jgi:hypothetical protein
MREVFLCANTKAKAQLEGRGAHGMEVRKASEAPNFPISIVLKAFRERKKNKDMLVSKNLNFRHDK